MSLSDLSRLWTEPTKIGHIFKKQSFQKKSFKKVNLLAKYSLQKKNPEKLGWFLMPKNDFKSTNFANF